MKRSYVLDSFGPKAGMIDTCYEAILKLAATNKDIVLVAADTPGGPFREEFTKNYPERVFDVGIAEGNLISVGAGMAEAGKTPFLMCNAIFLVGRGYNQIRQSVAYDKYNVKMVLVGDGVLSGYSGASHQDVEGIAALRAIPNIMLISPADLIELKKAIGAAVEYMGPVAIRLAHPPVPTIYRDEAPFQLGKAITLTDGNDASIIATGLLVADSLEAADTLAKESINIRVIDMHTIKPLDVEAVTNAAKETGAIVTVEDANILGGLGAAVAEVVVENVPVPMKRIGVRDRFGQSGTYDELKNEYELSTPHIAQAVYEVVKRKKARA